MLEHSTGHKDGHVLYFKTTLTTSRFFTFIISSTNENVHDEDKMPSSVGVRQDRDSSTNIHW